MTDRYTDRPTESQSDRHKRNDRQADRTTGRKKNQQTADSWVWHFDANDANHTAGDISYDKQERTISPIFTGPEGGGISAFTAAINWFAFSITFSSFWIKNIKKKQTLDKVPPFLLLPASQQAYLSVCWYPCIPLGGERHWASKVSRLKTHHNDPASHRTQTSWPRVQPAQRKAARHPRTIVKGKVEI